MPPTQPADVSRSGLEAVFLANRPALLRFARARGAANDAEDIIQDLWTRVSANASGPVADPLAYLFRMTDNLMIDRLRAKARRQRREDEWRGSYEASRTEAVREPHAERGIIARQQLDLVESRLATLGERTLGIFRRYRLDGVSQPRIAAEFGISLSAVEKHLQRAYRVLLSIRAEESAALSPVQRLSPEGSSDGNP